MNWIKSPADTGEQAVYFDRRVIWRDLPVRIEAKATAKGVYNLFANGRRVNKNALAPGKKINGSLQVQTYDLFRYFPLGGTITMEAARGGNGGVSVAAEITAFYADGSIETVSTGADWMCRTHPVRVSADGETIDTAYRPKELGRAVLDESSFPTVPQTDEEIKPLERIAPAAVITAPNGDRILDFEREITGWVELTVEAPYGSLIAFDHGLILDKDGNFVSSKVCSRFVLNGDKQVLAPHFSFCVFRYIRLLETPFETIDPAQFTAVVLSSVPSLGIG